MPKGNTGMRVNTSSLAADMLIVTLTIPANTGDGKTLRKLIEDSLGLAANETPEWWQEIATWEIVENVEDILVSRQEDAKPPNFVFDADKGFNPPLGRPAMSTLFFRSQTAATSKAMLLVHIMDRPVGWDNEEDPDT